MSRLLLALLITCGTAAIAWAQAPVPVRAYELNDSLADTFGGPSMVNNGGTLGPVGITFGPNNGPSLSNWTTGTAASANYSIELYFSFTDITGYRKIIDFKDRTSDNGLYNRDGVLNFYNFVSGPANEIAPNTLIHLVLTRDSATNLVTAFINGNLSLSFNDGTSAGDFTSTGNIMHYFRDDSVTGGEASAGFVDFIRIYDHPLNSSEAQALFAAVPEPSTVILSTLGFGTTLTIALRYRRKRKHRSKKKEQKNIEPPVNTPGE